ncbi:MAG: hypothetical protein IPF82_17200 [Blastocatellia bacterium]|nr:hypothetical protein [Blastocatellia bacterium]
MLEIATLLERNARDDVDARRDLEDRLVVAARQFVGHEQPIDLTHVQPLAGSRANRKDESAPAVEYVPVATTTEGEFFSAFASALGRAILEITKARQRDSGHGNPSSQWPLSDL